jgi:hypothetical protein
MGKALRYLWDFTISAGGALTLAAMSFVDPLKALEGLNVDVGYKWLITPDERRALFLFLAFVWMLVWYIRVRVRYDAVAHQPTPDMPLHVACRWIARDSTWAESSSEQHDGEWVTLVKRELMSKVAMGRVELFGERRLAGGTTSPLSHMVPAFKDVADWDAHKLATDEPPTHMYSMQGGGDVYYRVLLDSNQVKRVWPQRSHWARWRKRSPIERIGEKGYKALFASQDQEYRTNFEKLPLAVLLTLK